MAKDHVHYDKTKRVEINQHIIREWLEERTMESQYVAWEQRTHSRVDIFNAVLSQSRAKFTSDGIQKLQSSEH